MTAAPMPPTAGRLRSGLFNFTPNLGAIIGGGPILLMTLPLGATPLLIVVGLYIVIHIGVGYAVLPLIQQQAMHLPPAWALASPIPFGVLFGAASVALAMPIVAAIGHVILRLQHFSPHAAAHDRAQ